MPMGLPWHHRFDLKRPRLQIRERELRVLLGLPSVVLPVGQLGRLTGR